MSTSDSTTGTTGSTTGSTETVIWKGSKGHVPITEMVTIHLKNAITKVEQELTEAGVAAKTEKEAILSALKKEFDSRSDKDTASSSSTTTSA